MVLLHSATPCFCSLLQHLQDPIQCGQVVECSGRRSRGGTISPRLRTGFFLADAVQGQVQHFALGALPLCTTTGHTHAFIFTIHMPARIQEHCNSVNKNNQKQKQSPDVSESFFVPLIFIEMTKRKCKAWPSISVTDSRSP